MMLDILTTFLQQKWMEAQKLFPLAADLLIQVGIVAGLLLVSLAAGKAIRKVYRHRFSQALSRDDLAGRLLSAVDSVLWLLVFMVLLLLALAQCAAMDMATGILVAALSLCQAWIVIRLVSGLFVSGLLLRLVAWSAWSVAVLHVCGLLEPVLASLNSMGLTLGESYISVLTVLKGLLLFGLLLRVVKLLGGAATRRLEQSDDLSPSLQALFSKLLTLGLYTVAFLAAVSAVGVDLTSLAVLSGALGVGIGFGLREIFANLISGILLLMDRAVKPGDVIEVEGASGEITAINIRYSVVRTRDGKEYVLPNESLVVNPVVLWTRDDPVIRLKIPVGIHYGSDPRLAMRLMEQAAAKTPRVLDTPEPGARLLSFGDNSVNLELRVWIRDAEKGVVNVQSEILLAVWDLFHEHGVQLPYPQRDIHIKELPEAAIAALSRAGATTD